MNLGFELIEKIIESCNEFGGDPVLVGLLSERISQSRPVVLLGVLDHVLTFDGR